VDPLTHGLVGMALGLQNGGSLSLANGTLVASVIGSLLPDADIVFQIRGDYAYLKQHRGFSHSLPTAVVAAALTGWVLTFFYPNYGFGGLFAGVLVGFLSHLFLDLLNSYGVKILWPLSQRKYTLNLLPLFDPFLVLICLLSKQSVFLGLVGFYLGGRWLLKKWAEKILRTRFFPEKCLFSLNVLPASANPLLWDFILETENKFIVGSLHLAKGSCQIFRKLVRVREDLAAIFQKTLLGQLFREFTPFYHFYVEKEDEKLVCRFMDLRYRVQDRFLHNGTLVMDSQGRVIKEIFQPYSPAHVISL